MKDYLAFQGIDVSLPRDVVRQTFHHQLIQDRDVWVNNSRLKAKAFS